MNLRKCFLFFTVTFFVSLSSFAGDEVCNGGDVVVCSGKKPVLLDIVERSALYGLSKHPMEGFISFTRSYRVQTAISQILESLQDNAPEVSKCLSSYADSEQFWSEISFVDSVEFGDVVDETAYVVPKGCQKKQAAIQFRKMKPYSGHRYLINNDLWKAMDDFQRATLILHEIILRNYILNPLWRGDTTSVRYLTALIGSEEVSNLTPKQFNAILEDISFTCTMSK